MLGPFCLFFDVPEAWEAFQRLPGGGSSIFTEYEPVAYLPIPLHFNFHEILAHGAVPIRVRDSGPQLPLAGQNFEKVTPFLRC